jgi:succinate dehydrogenase / fumarate reductase cytochrome b subunit
MRLSDNLFFRRLHSLTGAVPLGAFLVFHLYANSFALSGPAAYDEHVRFLRSLPYLHVLEWGLIFLPLLYHSLYGLFIWYTGANNFPQYNYARNGLYLMQRLTGIVALVFVVYHIADQRLLAAPSFFTVKSSISNPAVFILYFVGTASVAWHMMNGLWNFTVKWGIAAGERAQRTLLAVFSVLGAGLVFVGLRALTGFIG